jgi:hypothetical protein
MALEITLFVLGVIGVLVISGLDTRHNSSTDDTTAKSGNTHTENVAIHNHSVNNNPHDMLENNISDSIPQTVINPANGLPMMGDEGGIDVAGNTYGTDHVFSDHNLTDESAFNDSVFDDTSLSDSSFDDSSFDDSSFDDNF